MIDWIPYLESISKKYAQWWEVYTLTDVEGRKRQPKTAPLLGDFWVEEIKIEKDNQQEREEKRERFTVLDGLRKYASNHVLLKGRPGSGKSTALARLLLETSVGAHSVRPNQQNQAKISQIPILIELRYYQTSIIDLILQFLQRHELPIDEKTLENFLKENDSNSLLLLFDGINELPSETARQDLQKFRQNYAKIPMIFTTRDIGIGGDLNIEKKLEMLPLTEAQMRDFVKAYLPEKGELMLKKLGNRLKEFGQTPLLLWMLCSVFKSNKNQIPANLGMVFRLFAEDFDIRKREKEGVKISDKLRRWQKRLLQHLAWMMTTGEKPTEIKLSISRSQAEEILVEFLQGKVLYPDDTALECLEDLLKYYLIQLTSDKHNLEFPHQLIQEYYTAEALLQQLSNLSDEELQWDYLNYLKWTEPVALMLGMADKKAAAIRVVKLALNIDKKLGARLAGEVKKDWQKETVALIMGLNLPQFFTILLLGEIRSDDAIPGLLKALEDSDKYVRRKAAAALGNIGSETAIAGLLKALEDSDWNVRGNAAEALGKIGTETAIAGLLKALEDSHWNVREKAAEALGKIGTETAIAGLLKALEDSREYVRGKAAEALGNIGSEAAMAQLINCLKNSDFVTLNDGDTFSASIKALDTIQNKLKYYHPLSQPMNQPSSEKNSPSSSNQSGSSRLSMIN